jgi:hypothetical protein
MTPAEVHRLRAEVKSDRIAFEARLDELSTIDVASGNAAVLAQAAVALHHAYGAVEAALARVARLLEGSLPQGADWHQQLLRTMTLEIPSVRPAVVSQLSATHLQKLLAFRHFFRHAYAVAWDREQLATLARVARDLAEPLARDLDALDEFLAKLAATLGA